MLNAELLKCCLLNLQLTIQGSAKRNKEQINMCVGISKEREKKERGINNRGILGEG